MQRVSLVDLSQYVQNPSGLDDYHSLSSQERKSEDKGHKLKETWSSVQGFLDAHVTLDHSQENWTPNPFF